MPRLTKHDIESTLLSGRMLKWKDASNKGASVQLDTIGKRRLYAFLLKHLDQQVRGVTDPFALGLWEAYIGSEDPATIASAATSSNDSKVSWRIKAMSSEHFGGLNSWDSTPFHYSFDGHSLVVDGPNGSGKSSLAAALIWAFTGSRPRDQSSAPAHVAASVMDGEDKSVGSWPPIATYPPKASDLSVVPSVTVSVVLQSIAGDTVTLERRLVAGSPVEIWSRQLHIPEVFVLTGLEMPARISHIRLKDGASGLPDAVQQLTGLDEVIAIGSLCDWLTHGARDYRSFAKVNKLKDHQEAFTEALEDAQRSLSSIGVQLPPYQPADAKTNDDALVKKGVEIASAGKELAEALVNDLGPDLNLGDLSVQRSISTAILTAASKLTEGLESLNSWQVISTIHIAASGEAGAALLQSASLAETQLAEALATNERVLADNRFQLKALSAAWHRDHGHGGIDNCPLCDQSLDSRPELKAELDSMKAAGEAATRTLADNVNRIHAALSSSIPEEIRMVTSTQKASSPRDLLLGDFDRLFGSAAPHAPSLKRFVTLVNAQAVDAPLHDLAVEEVAAAVAEQQGQQRRLVDQIAWARRSVDLARWFEENKGVWLEWWTKLSRVRPPEEASALLQAETLAEHLTRLTTALQAAEPYASAAAHLRLAIQHARKIIDISAEQKRRDDVAEALGDLKALKGLGESVARQAIADLSERIHRILQGLHTTERLQFHSAQLSKKDGLAVRAGFDNDIRVEATLIANSSWLRSFLWAFVFALREEATEQYGGDPLPVFVFDDPQATFDISHRLNWAQYVAGLQASESKAQVLITTHDEAFLPTLEAAGIDARAAHIAPARPETGPLAILEGNAVERVWELAHADRTNPAKAIAFLAESRIYIEGMLRSMLAGDGADLTSDSVAALGDRMKHHQAAQTPPWNRPGFHKLIGSLKGPPQLAHIERAHHGSRSTLTYAEASDFHKHWKNKLAGQLHSCFRDMREFRLLHGTVTAWHLPPPSVTLPEGYRDAIAQFPLRLLGRASAFSNGKVSEGRFTYEDVNDATEKPVRLGNHSAFRLTTRSLEPVAKPGDVLLIQNFDQPTPHSLVVARVDDRLMARRFVVSERSSDVAVLTAHAIDPHEIAAPVVGHRATFVMHKIVGVLFDVFQPRPPQVTDEVVQCNGEADISSLLRRCLGLVQVNGHSAQPLALDRQYLLIGQELNVMSQSDLRSVVDQPVIAADSNDARYFKRLRLVNSEIVILESLASGGAHEPEVLAAPGKGSSNALARLWPVHGVLFERPGS
jgi:hypothetical protein